LLATGPASSARSSTHTSFLRACYARTFAQLATEHLSCGKLPPCLLCLFCTVSFLHTWLAFVCFAYCPSPKAGWPLRSCERGRLGVQEYHASSCWYDCLTICLWVFTFRLGLCSRLIPTVCSLVAPSRHWRHPLRQYSQVPGACLPSGRGRQSGSSSCTAQQGNSV
jgi:hypothetical protein